MLLAREVVQESTRFSPNQLVFGHTVRCPLTGLWDELAEADPPKNLIDYVNGFCHLSRRHGRNGVCSIKAEEAYMIAGQSVDSSEGSGFSAHPSSCFTVPS